jgi:hypothetical protein
LLVRAPFLLSQCVPVLTNLYGTSIVLPVCA